MNELAGLLNQVNLFILIYKTAKEAWNCWDKETAELTNTPYSIWVTTNSTMKMLVENSTDFRCNNLSIKDKVKVFIPDSVDIQSPRPIVQDERFTDRIIVSSIRKIYNYGSQYKLLHYFSLFLTGIQVWNYKMIPDKDEDIQSQNGLT